MSEPVVVVPLHVAALLHRRLPHGLAALVAGRDAELDRVLAALRNAAVIEAELSVGRTTSATQSEQPPRWVTTSQATAQLHVGVRAVQQAISRGRLPAQRRGRTLLIERADLQQYAARRTG